MSSHAQAHQRANARGLDLAGSRRPHPASGLVSNRKRGRERWHYLNAVPLRRVYRRWVGLAEGGWAEGLLRLESISEAASMAEPRLALDIVQEISLAAPRRKVFEAITAHIDSWWGPQYANERATGLTLEARLG